MQLSQIALALTNINGQVAPARQTLDLMFIPNVYYVYEYGPLDPSLNLDFVNQSYGSE
jgi:hypothetical protein